MPLENSSNKDLIPLKYQELSSDVVEELWTRPLYLDPVINEEEKNRRNLALEAIRKTEQETRDKLNSVLSVPLTDEVVKNLKSEAHQLSKQQGGDINLDFYLNPIDWEIGERFDAHGIAKQDIYTQLDQLLELLNKRIDKNKPFYTAPLECSPEKKQILGPALGTAGGTAYKDGSFIVIGEVDSQLIDTGIKYVLVNETYYHAISILEQAYPDISFIRADESNAKLERIINQNLKQ